MQFWRIEPILSQFKSFFRFFKFFRFQQCTRRVEEKSPISPQFIITDPTGGRLTEFYDARSNYYFQSHTPWRKIHRTLPFCPPHPSSHQFSSCALCMHTTTKLTPLPAAHRRLSSTRRVPRRNSRVVKVNLLFTAVSVSGRQSTILENRGRRELAFRFVAHFRNTIYGLSTVSDFVWCYTTYYCTW